MASEAANRDSTSSVTNSNYSESVSGHSTPLTSNVPTPAPEKSLTRTSKFEVVIPASTKTRGSTATAMQKARDYIMGNDSKRKRGFVEIADSEDDELSDSSPIARRTRHDEKVARQLQEELDREAAAALISDDGQDASVDEMNHDSDDFSVAGPKGKGKGKAIARGSRSARSGAKNIILDSEEDKEDYLSESVDYKPPTKKQKTKGKAKMSAPPLSDDDDVPGKLIPYPSSLYFQILSLHSPSDLGSFHLYHQDDLG